MDEETRRHERDAGEWDEAAAIRRGEIREVFERRLAPLEGMCTLVPAPIYLGGQARGWGVADDMMTMIAVREVPTIQARVFRGMRALMRGFRRPGQQRIESLQASCSVGVAMAYSRRGMVMAGAIEHAWREIHRSLDRQTDLERAKVEQVRQLHLGRLTELAPELLQQLVECTLAAMGSGRQKIWTPLDADAGGVPLALGWHVGGEMLLAGDPAAAVDVMREAWWPHGRR